MSNFTRTDLASELINVKGRNFEGICKVSEIVLDAELAKKYGKGEGKYVTLETEALESYSDYEKTRLIKALKTELGKLMADRSKVLVVGLGNRKLTADALGAAVCERLNAGDRLKAISPGVAGATGIESFDIVKGVTERIKPSCIVAVDSLAAAATSRVCRVVQLCDAGITPGSGVSNHREKLSRSTLGVPVISVGVPLVVYASTIIRDAGGDDSGFETLIVTPKDIDRLVDECATVISAAINSCIT